MKQPEQLFAYSLGVVIFLSGLTLIFFLFIETNFASSTFRGFGIALCPTGMIGFEKGKKQFEYFSTHFDQLWEGSIPIEKFLETKKINANS